MTSLEGLRDIADAVSRVTGLSDRQILILMSIRDINCNGARTLPLYVPLARAEWNRAKVIDTTNAPRWSSVAQPVRVSSRGGRPWGARWLNRYDEEGVSEYVRATRRRNLQ